MNPGVAASAPRRQQQGTEQTQPFKRIFLVGGAFDSEDWWNFKF